MNQIKNMLDEYMFNGLKIDMEEKQREIEYLDTLDILPLMEPGLDAIELCGRLYGLFNDEYEGEYMFACLGVLELIDYLEERFHTNFDCTVRYYVNDDIWKGTRYDTDTISDIPEVV